MACMSRDGPAWDEDAWCWLDACACAQQARAVSTTGALSDGMLLFKRCWNSEEVRAEGGRCRMWFDGPDGRSSPCAGAAGAAAQREMLRSLHMAASMSQCMLKGWPLGKVLAWQFGQRSICVVSITCISNAPHRYCVTSTAAIWIGARSCATGSTG